ncbi:type II secretion system F family protein [Desulfohalobiaceae bacterium Ax17]|uniref:type II secretion system F family protein n=1 Tax=Desulfovulcanus ferrireducens TaxID=2831190 RepID=UPI00207BA2DC|nr:type II secretion system F family protein [Desulfovulcanus ferrireducens]MBT8764148.1 type II secretion system F family protein [Desulfovulcanus ferrireducens]
MSTFRFKLLTPQGEVETGFVELPFDDPGAALRYLERRGSVVLEVTRIPDTISFLMRAIKGGLLNVKRPVLAEFFNNLSMLLSAGVPILSALEELEGDAENPFLKLTIRLICTDIESGQTFGEAIEKHRRIFSPVLLHMIRIGEETGNLDKMLKKCSEHIQHLHEIISGTKRALMYPAFLSVMVVGAVIFWFWYVVPKLVSLFKEMGVALPLPTRILIYISDLFQNYFGMAVFIVAFVAAGVMIVRRMSYNFRYFSDNVLLHLPLLSNILTISLVARVSEFLGILIGAGIGVLRALEIIIDSISNEVYKKRLNQVKDAIKGGVTLSEALRQTQAMHPFALRMITVGEQTGRIEEQTEYIARVYRQKLDALVEVLGKTLEPALLVFVGILFAMIIAGLLLPIYDLISGIS